MPTNNHGFFTRQEEEEYVLIPAPGKATDWAKAVRSVHEVIAVVEPGIFQALLELESGQTSRFGRALLSLCGNRMIERRIFWFHDTPTVAWRVRGSKSDVQITFERTSKYGPRFVVDVNIPGHPYNRDTMVGVMGTLLRRHFDFSRDDKPRSGNLTCYPKAHGTAGSMFSQQAS